MENLLSTAEHRMLQTGDAETSVRLSDFFGVIPAITGKVELVYEGEQEGAAAVARDIIERSIGSLFPDYFPKIEKLERDDVEGPYDTLVQWFFDRTGFELMDDLSNADYKAQLDEVSPLDALIAKYQPEVSVEDRYFLKEFVIWGLVQYKKLSKYRFDDGLQFKDLYGSFIKDL